MNLYHGDCLEIMPALPPASIDAIITDLPYGTTACEWDSIIPLDEMWKQVKRVLKVNGAFVTTASQPFTSALIMSNVKWFRYCWVWDKTRATGGANADKAPMKAHEDIAVFGKMSPLYFPQMGSWVGHVLTRRKSAVTAKSAFSHATHISPGKDEKLKRGRFPDSVIRISALGSQDPERVGHETQKPVNLYEYLIRTYTQPGDTVLDIAMGSGTTIVSAIQTGRNAIGIEKEKKYYEMAIKRAGKAHPPLFTETATPANTASSGL